MKVIGITKEHRYERQYICTVGHDELAKFLGLYYGSKMDQLQIDAEIDLAKGHDFAREAADALRKTQEFIQSNQVVVTAILNGLQYANLPKPETVGEQAVAK